MAVHTWHSIPVYFLLSFFSFSCHHTADNAQVPHPLQCTVPTGSFICNLKKCTYQVSSDKNLCGDLLCLSDNAEQPQSQDKRQTASRCHTFENLHSHTHRPIGSHDQGTVSLTPCASVIKVKQSVNRMETELRLTVQTALIND